MEDLCFTHLDISKPKSNFLVLWDEFLVNLNETKRRKQAQKILDQLSTENSFHNYFDSWLNSVLQDHDFSFLKTISSLLELCEVTRSFVERNIQPLFVYLNYQFTILCNEELCKTVLTDFISFNEASMLTVKVLLQTLQFLSASFISEVYSTESVYCEVIRKFLSVFVSKRFSKECCLLGGTTLALLYSQIQPQENLSDEIKDMLTILFEQKCQTSPPSQTCFKLNSVVDSKISHLCLSIGLLKSTPNLLLGKTTHNEYLFDFLFRQIIDICSFSKDAIVKYLSFQVLLSWMSFVSLIGVEKLTTALNESLFLDTNSKYVQLLMGIMHKHVEDLVDGISSFVRKTFQLFWKINSIEVVLNGCQKNENKYLLNTCEDLLSRSWNYKGKWIFLSEIFPLVGYRQIFLLRKSVGDEMVQCLNTCGLASIVNDVYKNLLVSIRNECSSTEEAVNQWLHCCEEFINNALNSAKLLVQQNTGIYLLPTTLKVFPQCFHLLERNFQQNNLQFYAYMMLLKCARKCGLLTYKELLDRELFLVDGLHHLNVDVRIEAMNILCFNIKTTETLPSIFQNHLTMFVKDNLNCDSSKFRQQMLSCLKRILISLRESCVVLFRILTSKKERTEMKEQFFNLVDFVKNLLELSISCLHPASMFQRKKTGLLILELLTDLFVYIKDVRQRKKGGAPDSAAAFLQYIKEGENSIVSFASPKIAVIGSCDNELFCCLEDQHDEIREIAFQILTTHQNLSHDQFLSDSATFDKVLLIADNLMSSPKFHEGESGAMVIQFIISRILNDEFIGNHKLEFHCTDKSQRFIMFSNYLFAQIKSSFEIAPNDFLAASMERPIFGGLLGLSKCLKVLFCSNDIHLIKSTGFNNFLKDLIDFVDKITVTMVCLLAGVYKKDATTQCISPSFAEIDKALDSTLQTCPSYASVRKTISHVHCRELLISFCWLNLKSVALILMEIGSLCTLQKDLISLETFKIICRYYENSLIKCRHKGVIEASCNSVSFVAKQVAYIPSLWTYMHDWCLQTIHHATDIKQHVSVTKRSAGIPMLIQSILSAETAISSGTLLQSSMHHLLSVATTPLPKTVSVTFDLPQFNAINVLKAVYRDNNLGNSVLPYAEEGIILTINGFSSSSWSIRNASTLLLGALLPRMLGQHATQENKNSNFTDVFFTWYPKLQELFLSCLEQQVSLINKNLMNSILPQLIPVLTFLSKLRSSDSDESKRLSEVYLSLFKVLLSSPVYTVRDLTSSSISSFVIHDSLYMDRVVSHILKINTKSNNVHGWLLVLKKLVLVMNNERIIATHELFYKLMESETWHNSIDFISKSVLLDIVCLLCDRTNFNTLRVECFGKYLLRRSREPSPCIAVGKSMYETSLMKLMVMIIKHGTDDDVMNIISNELPISDIHTTFFEHCAKEKTEFNEINALKIFNLTIQCISQDAINLNLIASTLKYMLNCQTKLIEDNKSIEFLFKLQRDYLYLVPFTLPYLSKVSISLNNDKYLDQLSKCIIHFAQQQTNDYRIAASQSCTHLLNYLVTKSQRHADTNKSQFQIIDRLLSSSLLLLQDEDEDVRIAATKIFQFLYSSPKHMLPQTNIVMKDFFVYIKQLAHTSDLYLSWVHCLFCGKLDENILVDDNKEMLLFEQEASNLYAEEDQLIDFITQLLNNVYSTKEIDGLTKDTYITEYKDICGRLIAQLQPRNGIPIKSVYGVYGNRQQHLRLFKLLNCLHVLAVLGEVENDKYRSFLVQLEKSRLPQIIRKVLITLIGMMSF